MSANVFHSLSFAVLPSQVKEGQRNMDVAAVKLREQAEVMAKRLETPLEVRRCTIRVRIIVETEE